MDLTYKPKGEVAAIAQEVLEFLKPRGLPVWQVKDVLRLAARLAEYQKLE